MAIIKQYHKDTDTTYVYESESYWDPDKKQPRSRRRVIGKVDRETGKTVPTGKRGRKKKAAAPSAARGGGQDPGRLPELYEQAERTISQNERVISSQKDEIAALKKELSALKGELSASREQNKSLKNALRKIKDISGGLPL